MSVASDFLKRNLINNKVLIFKESSLVKDLMSLYDWLTTLGITSHISQRNLNLSATWKKKVNNLIKLIWTPERRQYFVKVEQALIDLPKLFFLNDSYEIRVYVDTSDYAIGGYVCQVVNGVERPKGFMSCTLVNAERRWTAIEKERYVLHITFLNIF